MRSGADIDGIENSETITARVPLNCPSLVSVPCRRIPGTVADRFCDRAARVDWSLGHYAVAGGTSLLIRIRGWLFCHRYSSATCPNRRRTCLLLNLPISKSVVRLNATEPAWPNTFQSPFAQSIAAAGLGQSIGSPAATPPSMKSKGKATKEVISVIGYNCLSTPQEPCIAV
jgi:hypothetical protein